MKLKLYMNIFQGWKPENAYACSDPSYEIPAGFKRLSFVVEIPDYIFEPSVDIKIQETSVAGEVK